MGKGVKQFSSVLHFGMHEQKTNKLLNTIINVYDVFVCFFFHHVFYVYMIVAFLKD
jgi:hypothetical protein